MTTKTFSRRQALRTAATTLWLPLLPSLMPRDTWANEPTAPRRIVIWFLPHGLQDVHVAPQGNSLSLTAVTSPIEALQGRVSVVTKLHNVHARSSHGRATASLLTDVEPDYGLEAGISVDQVVANEQGNLVPHRSLQLAVDSPGRFNNNAGILSSRLSWASPTVPLAPTLGPAATFDLLFRGAKPNISEAEAERRRQLRHSVLDAVRDRITGLEPKLSSADRIRLDQYTTGIRDLERRIDGLADRVCETPLRAPDEVEYAESIELMSELQQLAIGCDLTRVITYMYGPSASDASLPDLGITRGSHTLSHAWAYDDQANEDFQAMNAWHVRQYVDFCRGLAGFEDPDGTDVLSSTLVVLASEFSDANRHETDKLAMLVAGGESGGTSPGRHINGAGASHGNLMRSLLRFAQVSSSGFGSTATGSIPL